MTKIKVSNLKKHYQLFQKWPKNPKMNKSEIDPEPKYHGGSRTIQKVSISPYVANPGNLKEWTVLYETEKALHNMFWIQQPKITQNRSTKHPSDVEADRSG